MSNEKGRFALEEAYHVCKGLKENEVIDVDQWMGLFKSDEREPLYDIPPKLFGYDPEWTRYIGERNRTRYRINALAKRNEQNWRILIWKRGSGIIKSANSKLISLDVPERCKIIAKKIDSAKGEWDSLIIALRQNSALSLNDETLLKGLSHLFTGIKMTAISVVRDMGIDPETKSQLLTFFDKDKIA